MTKQIAGVKLTVADRSDKLVTKAVDLFARRWKERTRVPLKAGGSGGWELTVGTVNQPEVRAVIEAAGLKVSDRPQSYAIAASGRTLTVCGADGNGVLYGLGYLLRQLEFETNRVPLPKLRESRIPAVYNRGVYFASHFNNYYEAAPMEEIERYIEEMALWGFDMLAFWFDGNWFPNNFWKDPNSRGSRMAKRLRRIGEVARACGLKVTSLGIGNEGFYNLPPKELRADPSARHGGFYMNSQICPSKPGGLKMILDVRRKILELIGPIEAFTIWPYDQGGCGCAQCTHAPGRWGKKFLEIAPLLAQTVREVNPDSQIYISTWLMDETERKMVYELCDQNPGWFQGVMTEVDHATERKLDARYERLVFPEISMFDCYFCSYGCNGANPAPKRFAVDASAVARSGSGTALYSEGCYEDINKIVYASLMWDPKRDVADVLAEYTRYYFGKANMKAAMELIRGLETTWGAAALLKADSKTVLDLAKKAGSLKTRIPRHHDAKLRWQMLNDRANIDWLMKQPQPWKELVVANRDLYEVLGYAKGSELRPKIKKLHAALQLRQKQVKQLFEAHWEYMRYFHMENTCLIFLPDDVLGKYNFDPLAESLGKALKQRDDEAMRSETSRAFKHWFWFNGIDYKYLFD